MDAKSALGDENSASARGSIGVVSAAKKAHQHRSAQSKWHRSGARHQISKRGWRPRLEINERHPAWRHRAALASSASSAASRMGIKYGGADERKGREKKKRSRSGKYQSLSKIEMKARKA